MSYDQAPISNSSMRFDENDAAFLILQESVDQALLEGDRHEPVFYNALSFEHTDYDISSSAPDIWKKFITLQQLVSKNCQ